MSHRCTMLIAACIAGMTCIPAAAQDITVGDLKAKGATILSAEELKALLPGASLRYETPQFSTQMTLNKDGSLIGRGEPRIGASGERNPGFTGNWEITGDGRWCGATKVRGAEYGKFCRDIFKLGDKYYYAGGNRKNDMRPAFETSISQ